MILPIVFTCDNNYFKYTNVVITSIIENRNTKIIYKIHILSEDLSEENRLIAERQLSKYDNIEITFHILSDIDKSRFYLNSYMSVTTYYRFYICELFPQYDRILYLDSDLIVENDISELASIDFENRLAICTSSPYIKGKISKGDDEEYPFSYFKETLKMQEPLSYFNAGVILYNLKLMRTNNIQQKLFEALIEIPEPKLQDQDILNSVFSRNGGVKLISNQYNYTPAYRITVKRLFFDRLMKKWGLMKNPWFYIYHYVGRVKPWHEDNGINTSLFYKYAYKSPFFDEIVQDNKLAKEELVKKYFLKWL